MWKAVDLAAGDKFAGYLQAASRLACPYIRGSVGARLLYFKEVDVDVDLKSIEVEFFIFSEAIYAVRDFLSFDCGGNSTSQHLLCFNIVFKQSLHVNLEQEFFIPHFLLKNLFTDAGVIFGKFWVDEVVKPRRGLALPKCGVNFLSIRGLQGRLDNRFFTRSPHLLELKEDSNGVSNAQETVSGLTSLIEANGLDAYVWLREKNASAAGLPSGT